MSDDELEPLDPVLASLFDDERRRGDAPAGARARVLDRLTASFGAAAGGASHAGPGSNAGRAVGGAGAWTSRALPILGAFVVGGAVGGVAVSALSSPRVVYVDRVVPAPAPVRSEPTSSPQVTAPPEDVITSAPSASAPPARRAADSGRDDTLVKERAILDVARTALGRGDGASAIDAVERHAREFPRGQMSEEREAIGVQALAKLGRHEAAATRGAAFRQRYPNSVLAPVIDAALATNPNHDGIADGGL